jgi:hypothetical protein
MVHQGQFCVSWHGNGRTFGSRLHVFAAALQEQEKVEPHSYAALERTQSWDPPSSDRPDYPHPAGGKR